MIDVTKIPGLQSWAGLGTEHLPWADQAKCVKGLDLVWATVRMKNASDIATRGSSMA